MTDYASGTHSSIIIYSTRHRVDGHPLERKLAGDDERWIHS